MSPSPARVADRWIRARTIPFTFDVPPAEEATYDLVDLTSPGEQVTLTRLLRTLPTDAEIRWLSDLATLLRARALLEQP